MIEFDWNPSKSRSNLLKHGVDFEEAITVFYDENALQFYDQAHSETEDRFIMMGMSYRMRILLVIHSEQDEGSTIRIISARKATSKERSFYTGSL